MKNLEKKTRPLSEKELKALRKIRSAAAKEAKKGFRVQALITAVIVGCISVYLATWTRYDLIAFIFGTVAVFSAAFVVVVPYEIYMEKLQARRKVNEVDAFLLKNGIDVFPVRALRIALAKEYDDEGDLYLVEITPRKVLYIWDSGYNLKKNFPALEFEIYSDDYFRITGRQVIAISEKIKPEIVDPKHKWAYLKKNGSPEHLHIDNKDFDKLLKDIHAAS